MCHSIVKWNSVLSYVFDVKFGVRQGSVIITILFALYLDDIWNNYELNPSSYVILYADDILLISSSVCELQRIFTRTWLCYVRVFAVAIPSVCLSVCLSLVCRLSVVCNVGSPYSRGWTFRQYFFTAVYDTILWPPCKVLRRSSQGKPSVGSVKRKRGSKIQRCWTYRRLYLINGTR